MPPATRRNIARPQRRGRRGGVGSGSRVTSSLRRSAGASGSRRTGGGANPFAAPRGRDGGRRSRHGRDRMSGSNTLGTISLACGIASFVCLMGMIAGMGLFVDKALRDDSSGAMAGAGMMLVFMVLFWIAVLLGLGTGIAGVNKANAPKGMAIIGLVINGVWLLLNLVSMVLRHS